MSDKRHKISKSSKENSELKKKRSSSFHFLEDPENSDVLETVELFDNELSPQSGRDHMYRMLIENMSEGALVINHQRIIVYSNKQFANFMDIPLQKIIGADLRTILEETDLEKFDQCIKRAGSKKTFCEAGVKFGHLGSMMFSVSPLIMDNDQYFCLIVTDITFQKDVEKGLQLSLEEKARELSVANRKLKEINQELNGMNDYLENFVHALAHDLRTPVANLKLIEEMFDKAPDADKKQLLSSIHNNIDRLDITLKGLVQIIDTQGRKEIARKKIQVLEIIKEVINDEKYLIDSYNARITIEADSACRLNYVEGYIRSIARNMISNALKYAKPDKQPTLTIKYYKKEGYDVFSFRDNGIGIDLSRQKEKLFKPFQRISSEGNGLGIGLHIINNMVKKNGGKIEVESEPGKGSNFLIHLKEYDL